MVLGFHNNESAAALRTLLEKPMLYGPDLSVQDAGPQYGGSVVDYANRLSFATVHGSGHMVLQFRPQAALHMLRKVLRHERFAPLLPAAAVLQNMTDAQFDSYLDGWTAKAQAAPYV